MLFSQSHDKASFASVFFYFAGPNLVPVSCCLARSVNEGGSCLGKAYGLLLQRFLNLKVFSRRSVLAY